MAILSTQIFKFVENELPPVNLDAVLQKLLYIGISLLFT